MTSIRRIIVALKEPQGKLHPAVLKAVQLARACGAQLELFHSLPTPVYAGLQAGAEQDLTGLERDLRQEALRKLETIAGQLRLHGIKVTVAAGWDYPVYQAIIRRAMRTKADLIVVSRHSGRHTAPWLLRLTDWELVRLSPVPVLLVKNSRAYRHPAVLTAVDPTHAFAKPLGLDREILRLGRVVSEGLRGTLHAVHAYARMPVGAATNVMTPLLFEKMELKALRSAKLTLARTLRTSRIAASRRYLIANDPISAISEAARKTHCALVVMGAVSRSGIKRLFIGNSAERILDVLSCDILVVKPPKFRNRISDVTRGPRVVMASAPGSMGFY